MRPHSTAWGVVLVVALATSAPAFAQDGAAKTGEQAMMDAVTKAATPGPEHKRFEMMAGTWTTETKAWMGPGEPMVSKGKSVHTTILDGRYLKQDFDGEFMNAPFKGTGLTGYDNVLKQYVLTWADSMGTGIILMKGAYDDATHTYTFAGTFSDPTTGRETPSKMTLRVTDKNHHVMEWWDTLPDGHVVKVMEISYTRA